MPQLKRIAIDLDLSHPVGRQIMLGVAGYVRACGSWIVQLGEASGAVDALLIDSPKTLVAVDSQPLELPTVCVTEPVELNPAVQYVVSDLKALAHMAAERLRQTGAAEVLIACKKQDSYAEGLIERFEAAQKQQGQSTRRLSIDPAATEPDIFQRLATVLADAPKPPAVLASDGHTAFGILQAARLAGLHVPQDLYLLAASPDEITQALSPVRISAMNPNLQKIGYEAAREVDRLLAGGGVMPPLRVPPEALMEGDTLPPPAISDELINRAIKRMASRLADPQSVPELATDLGVSRRLLELRFREVLGSSPAAKLRRLRLERASVLLRQTDQPISQIAVACGFSAVELLQRAMQKHLGMTPTEFRTRRS